MAGNPSPKLGLVLQVLRDHPQGLREVAVAGIVSRIVADALAALTMRGAVLQGSDGVYRLNKTRKRAPHARDTMRVLFLRALANGPSTARVLQQATGCASLPATYHHIGQLRRDGLVRETALKERAVNGRRLVRLYVLTEAGGRVHGTG